VVLGGLGKGFQLELPRFSGRWGLCVWTLPDLLRLSWMEEEWAPEVLETENAAA